MYTKFQFSKKLRGMSVVKKFVTKLKCASRNYRSEEKRGLKEWREEENGGRIVRKTLQTEIRFHILGKEKFVDTFKFMSPAPVLSSAAVIVLLTSLYPAPLPFLFNTFLRKRC